MGACFEKCFVQKDLDHVSLDSTAVKVHPDGTGALKNGPQSIGESRAGWTTKIHMLAAAARTAATFSAFSRPGG
jgi:hypothetical protein